MREDGSSSLHWRWWAKRHREQSSQCEQETKNMHTSCITVFIPKNPTQSMVPYIIHLHCNNRKGLKWYYFGKRLKLGSKSIMYNKKKVRLLFTHHNMKNDTMYGVFVQCLKKLKKANTKTWVSEWVPFSKSAQHTISTSKNPSQLLRFALL